MAYGLLADLVVVAHFAFVGFVTGGALLVLRWPRVAWIHIPAAAWGVWIEWAGWLCPLTPLENWLRARAGESTYTTDFVERYILPILYPADLTREIQTALGGLVLVLNVAIYAVAWRRGRR